MNRYLMLSVLLMLLLANPFTALGAELPTISQNVITGENRGGDWKLVYPVFSGGTVDWSGLNTHFSEDAKQLDKEFPPEALENVAEVPPDVWVRCSLTTDFYLETNESGLISLITTCYRFMGGAHGLTINEAFNIDPATGKVLQFSDIFPKGQLEKLCTEINQRIKAATSLPEDHPENGMYFPEACATPELPIFFFRGHDLVLQFPAYAIAPYAVGLPEFTFPLKDLPFRKR